MAWTSYAEAYGHRTLRLETGHLAVLRLLGRGDLPVGAQEPIGSDPQWTPSADARGEPRHHASVLTATRSSLASLAEARVPGDRRCLRGLPTAPRPAPALRGRGRPLLYVPDLPRCQEARQGRPVGHARTEPFLRFQSRLTVVGSLSRSCQSAAAESMTTTMGRSTGASAAHATAREPFAVVAAQSARVVVRRWYPNGSCRRVDTPIPWRAPTVVCLGEDSPTTS